MYTAERIANYFILWMGKTPSAHARRVAEVAESNPSFISLAQVLLSLGETDSLHGITRLSRARKIFLGYACAELGVSPSEKEHLDEWLRRFEKHLKAFARSDTNLGLSKNPEKEKDRLHYFLWRATCSEVNSDSQDILLPVCYRALQRKLYSNNGTGPKDRAVTDDLPNQLAIFIRLFPRDRIKHGRIKGETITCSDIRESIEAYRRSPEGIAELETRDRYVRQISDTLGLIESENRKHNRPYLSLDLSITAPLGLDQHREIFTEDDVDEEGGSLGLLVWQEPDEKVYEHPLETARYVGFGSWRRGTAPRSLWYKTTRERRVVTPNELRRLVRRLDEWAKTAKGARLALLIWLAIITGLPIKRLLNLRRIDGLRDIALLAESDIRQSEDAPIYFWAQHGVLLACPVKAPDITSRVIVGRTYRPQGWLIPLAIGKRGPHYAAIAESDMPSIKDMPFVFPRPKRSHLAMTLDSLTDLLREISIDITPENDPLTWSKLQATLRPYSVEAGLTPLLSGIAGGCPTRPIRTILHYVAYEAKRFYGDHHRAVSYIESIVDGNQKYHSANGLEVGEALADALHGCLGAAYVPNPGLVAQAWAAITECIATTDRWLNAATLRVIFVLQATTGIREQELPALRRSHLDIIAALLRIQGKASSYFREAREIPLASLAVQELCEYMHKTAPLAASHTSDSLFLIKYKDGNIGRLLPGSVEELVCEFSLSEQIPFAVRTLRHALRNELHERGAPYTAVNEAFGHVTMEETALHQLSGISLATLQQEFRQAAQDAASSLLGINRI